MKRLLSGLTALLMLTVMAPSAEAAGRDMDVSDEGVDFIKQYEGFSEKPYMDNGIWRIGYGTECKSTEYADGISEEEATELFHETLEEYVGYVNDFADENDIEFEQCQFDALVSFTYNLGSGWMDPEYKLSRYLSDGIENYDDITMMETVAAWCHVGTSVDEGLLNRRLAEAALLIYGDYEGDDSPEFVCAVLDSNGGSIEKDVLCFYEGDTLYERLPDAEREDYILAGWYYADGKEVGEKDTIDEDITLSARWFKDINLPFVDVAPDSWYYGYVGDLYSEGIVEGMTPDTFEPAGSVTYGQALKLILLSSGVEPNDTRIAGNHWAQPYMDIAIDEGIITEDFCKDLNAAISRKQIALLASKALGLTDKSGKSPFVDTDDLNVMALYNAGIVEGTTESDGLTYYYPDSSITRAEITTIIWRIMNYYEDNTHPGQIQYGSYILDILKGVDVYSYDDDKFYDKNGFRYYQGKETFVGIDVSSYQGNIDWDKVKKDGVDFAMIRVGGRGYGMEGKMYDDAMFEKNIEGAIDAGLDVGVYYFSQAITVKEAEEEAEYVLEKIKDYDISYPVVFDWERIGGTEARTYGLETDILCKIANTFCGMIADEGYTPMIYFNSYCGYVKYDLSEIDDYDFWFARYNDVPGFYYDFDMWQYRDSGDVDGIDGNVDLNISFKDYSIR